MNRPLSSRRIRILPTVAAALLAAAICLAFPAFAADLLPAYPENISALGTKVVEAAGPGKEKAVADAVRKLRIAMHSQGILSINAIPDLIFQRAAAEGWKKEAGPSLRAVKGIAPFSVPMWAWLVKEDVLTLNLESFLQDAEGFSGALRRFGPAQVGYAIWLLSFLSAAAGWFVVWSSLSLFLRARPSLEGDVQRFLTIPAREYAAPLLTIVIFLLPLAAGLGLGVVACIWFVVSAGYLRQKELAILTTAILLLVGVFLGGGMFSTLRSFSSDADSSGWLGGEGSLALVRPKEAGDGSMPLSSTTLSWMVRFEKARAEMQSGNAAVSERMWTSLKDEGHDMPEVLNNRGVTRAQQGRIEEAIADFEAARAKRSGDGPSLWNSYQAYLKVFSLERARNIQPAAWEAVRMMSPYNFQPSDMEQGEWMASAMPVGEIWKAVFQFQSTWLSGAEETDLQRMFFRPFKGQAALLFLLVVWLSSAAWKLVSGKLWIHGTCLACGSRTLVVRSRESDDICPQCRVKIGGGVRAGDERDRRIQGIGLHRTYVRVASLLVPGQGALWSGKGARPLLFGIFLSLALAGITSSVGGERLGGPLVSELQSVVTKTSIAVACILWIAGGYWGVRSFDALQRSHNISKERI